MKKLYTLLIVVALGVGGYFAHKEYIYRETQKVINEYPEIYKLFKKDAEDILGEEFDLTTRKGIAKVKKDESFWKVEEKITQNRQNNWKTPKEIDMGNKIDNEQALTAYYFGFIDKLQKLL